jgi:serine/threonine-protein kinase
MFSAAIVFYELLTGLHPFQAPFIPKRIATDLPDPIGEIAPGLPILMQDAISRGLEKDPEQRFHSAEEFALALRDAADGLDEEGYSGFTGSDVASFDGDTQSIALDATVAMPVSKPGKE